ncbi:MAG TPA: gas vesicle protein GvpG [Ktedonobacteraceae bacterium]|jgi:hypothetical protein
MFIVDDLTIGLPAKGLMGIFKTIAEVAEDELTDQSHIKEELLFIQTLYETDQISEDEYEQRESELLQQLTEAREVEIS